MSTVEEMLIDSVKSGCIEKFGLPGTAYQSVDNNTNYSKVMNFKTHVVANGVTSSTKQMYIFRVFTQTSTTLEEGLIAIRAYTGMGKSENVLLPENKFNRCSMVLGYESDGSVNLYVQADLYQQVKFQMISGDESCVTYNYNSPFDVSYIASVITPIYDEYRVMLDTLYLYKGTTVAPLCVSRDIGGVKKSFNVFVDSSGNTVITGTKTHDPANIDHTCKIVLGNNYIDIIAPTVKINGVVK